MKLIELLEAVPAPEDVVGPMKLADDGDNAQGRNVDMVRRTRDPRVTPKPNSNIAKAKRIATRARMKAKEADQTGPIGKDDTSHASNLGGHGSTFLNR